MALQLEDALHHLHLSCSRLQAAEGDPIIDHQSRANDIRAPVDSSGTERHLKEVTELVQLFNSGLRVHQPAIVANHAISSHQQVVGDRISEDLNTQSVSYDLFSLLVEVRMDEGDVIIASNTVSQCGKFFLHPNNFHSFGEGVANVPQFVVSGVVRDKEALFIAGCGPADDSGSTNSGLDDWNKRPQLALKHAVEVVRATCCDQAVAVGQLREYTNVVRVLELNAVRHQQMIILIQQKNKYQSKTSDQFWWTTFNG